MLCNALVAEFEGLGQVILHAGLANVVRSRRGPKPTRKLNIAAICVATPHFLIGGNRVFLLRRRHQSPRALSALHHSYFNIRLLHSLVEPSGVRLHVFSHQLHADHMLWRARHVQSVDLPD
jgi:hypothetical protein